MIRRALFIAFAVLLSGAAALMVHAFLSSRPSPRGLGGGGQGNTPSVVRVLVANTDLPTGAVLRDADFHWQAWPAESAAPYIVEGHARAGDFDGAVLRSRLTAGEPIIAGEAGKPGERGFMAAILSPGDSAVTVAVTPSTGMAGFIFPGDRVDLLLTMAVPAAQNAAPRRMSRTLLSDLRVVGVDQTLSDEHRTDKKDLTVPKTVTLEVTPKQAEIVAVASDLGVLSLSLRSLPTAPDGVPPTAASLTWDSEVTHLASPRAPAGPRPFRAALVQVASPVRVFRGGSTVDAAPPLSPETTPP